MVWAGKRVFVTGATGFIGQWLARRLCELGAQVSAAVAPGDDPRRVAGMPKQVEQLSLDLREPDAIQAAVGAAAPELILHLAAVGVANPDVRPAVALSVNVGGTVHLLEAARRHRVPRTVLTGTCHEYGARGAVEGLDPSSVYAASKVAAWAFGRMYWRAHGLAVVTVRPFQVYGPGQPPYALVPGAIRAALAGEDFPMTPGEQARDFVYVGDVVEGMLAAAAATGVDGESLDLGTGEVHTVGEVVALIWQLTAAQGRILAGARSYRPGVVMHLAAAADRTARLTGWRARVKLEEGLWITVDRSEQGT